MMRLKSKEEWEGERPEHEKGNETLDSMQGKEVREWAKVVWPRRNDFAGGEVQKKM
jgi:hypothetical protein